MKNKILLGSAGFILALLFMAGICLPALAQDAQTNPSDDQEPQKLIINNIQNNPNLSPTQKQEMISRIQKPGDQNDVPSCFDFFRFGSVSVSTKTSAASFFAGKKAEFTATVTNENDYPIVDGNLWGQILRENPAGEAQNGNHLIDQFLAADDINLQPNESKTLNFSYNLLGDSPGGKYYLATFFSSAKNYEISGQTTVSNMYANLISFDVIGPSQGAVFVDRNNVRLDDKVVEGRSPSPEAREGSDVKINFPLVNEKKTAQQVKLTYTLYSWDTFEPEKAVATSSETLNLDANTAKDLQYVIPKIQSGTYQLRISAESQNAKSMYEIRLGTDNVKKGRVDFAGISRFPPEKGDAMKMFACFHNAGYGPGDNGEVVLTLTDGEGKMVAQKNYKGFVSGAAQALEQEFQAASKYSYLKLTAEVKDKNGKTVDSVSTVYDGRLSKSAAAEESGGKKEKSLLWILAIIAILLLVSLLVYVIVKKMGSRNIVIVLILAGASLTFFFSARTTLAYNNSYTAQIGSTWYWLGYVPVLNGSLYLDKNCLFKKDGTCVKNGDTLNVGDVITFAEQQGDWSMAGNVHPCPPFSRKWYSVGKDDFGFMPPCGYKYQEQDVSLCDLSYMPNCDSIKYDANDPLSPFTYTCSDWYGNIMCMAKSSEGPSIIPGRAYIKDRTVNIAPDITGSVNIVGESVTAVQQGATVTLTVDPTFTIRNQLYYNFSKAVCDVSDVPSRVRTNNRCYNYGGCTCGTCSPDPCTRNTDNDIENVPSKIGNVNMKLQVCDYYPHHDILPPWGLYSDGKFLIDADATIHPAPEILTLHIAGPKICPACTLSAVPSSVGVGGASYMQATCSDGVSMPSWSWTNSTPAATNLWVSATNQNATTGLAAGNSTITATASNGTSCNTAVTVNATPIPGQCKTPPNNQTYCPSSTPPTGAGELCNAYDPSRLPTLQGSGPWSWTCYGSGGGSDMSCNAYLGTKTDGQCGTADGTTICENNTLIQWCAPGSTLVGSAPSINIYDVSWQCAGTCDGQTVDCSARGTKACGWIETSP